MKLSDLLSELRENILHDRSDRVAGTSDYLWTDATLIRYINEAYFRFAREGLVLWDKGNAPVTQVTLATGVTEYPLHESIMHVVSAKLTTDTGDLAVASHAPLNSYRAPNTVFFDPAQVAAWTDGKPLAYSTDEYLATTGDDARSRVVMRVYPAPTATYNGDTIDLRVIRLPIEELTAANLQARPEIPATHHIEMLDWAAYLALRIVDDDAGMPSRAKEFAKSFAAHVAEAERLVRRKLHKPVKWQFGEHGFGWSQGHG